MTEALRALGYRGGMERVLDGRSRTLTQVRSRGLVLYDPADALAFVELVHRHADGFFGVGTSAAPLRADRGARVTCSMESLAAEVMPLAVAVAVLPSRSSRPSSAVLGTAESNQRRAAEVPA